jgi:ABC-type glycerol-3-phosphate transport system substrate-binding protein
VLAGLGLGAAGLLAGCAGDSRGTVRVGVVWSGAELAEFRRALRRFTAAEGWDVSVVSLGDDAAPLLAGQVARGFAPEVAILPQPGLVTGADRLGDRLEDLSALPPPDGVSPLWRRLAEDRSGVLRGVWYKTTHKSLVWYRPDVFAGHGLAVPHTWSEWLALVRGLAAEGPLAPFGLGAADGWILTDLLENLLLGLDPGTFEGLVTGAVAWDAPPVRTALELLAALWSPPGAFPGGIRRALQTQFEDSMLDVVVRRDAAMVVGADSAYTVARQFARPVPPLRWFRVPAPPGGRQPLLVGGDLAVLLRPASRGASRLIRWLAGADAARDWAADGGFVSLRPDVTTYPSQYGTALTRQVRDGGGAYGFDLSDRLPAGGLTGGDGKGLWRILQRFLADLGRGIDPGPVVDDTIVALTAAAARAYG